MTEKWKIKRLSHGGSVTLLVIVLLISLALVGVTCWSLTGLYKPGSNWWSGSSATRATSYTVFGAIPGVLVLILIARALSKDVPSAKKRRLIAGIQAALLGTGIIVTALCIPYLMEPLQVMDNARQELARSWGSGWESQMTKPAHGPWLDQSWYTNMHSFALPYDASAFTVARDVEFMQIGGDSFKVDVYSPVGDGPFAVIINIHGGGWTGMDKDTIIQYQAEYLAAAGYVVFSVQYGAAGEKGMHRQYSMQEILDNLASFSDWLALPLQVSQYKVDLTRCFVVGLSAGGHLSALLSVARFNVTAWNPGVHLLGGIDFYGITDIRHWNTISAYWLNSSGLFNESVLADFTIVDHYSPITYVQATSTNTSSVVPLLIFHGDADTVVPVNQSRQFDALCDARGLKCTYVELPGAPHVFEGNKNDAGAFVSLWVMERFLQLCQ